MNRRTLALISAATLALASCGHKADDAGTAGDNTATDMSNTTAATADTGTTNDAGMNGASTANSAAPAAAGAQTFVNMAAASDAFEIASSKLAQTAAHSPSVKKFATQMISAHTASTAKLKALATGLTPPITPDPMLNAEQQSKIDELKGKTGADFDQTYIADQVAQHQQTLDTLNGYAATGDVPQLKTFASGLAPTVTAHLNMAKGLKP